MCHPWEGLMLTLPRAALNSEGFRLPQSSETRSLPHVRTGRMYRGMLAAATLILQMGKPRLRETHWVSPAPGSCSSFGV